MRNEIRPIPLPFPEISAFQERERERERGEGAKLLLPGAQIDLGLFSKATNLANARATGAGAGPFPARQRNNAAATALAARHALNVYYTQLSPGGNSEGRIALKSPKKQPGSMAGQSQHQRVHIYSVQHILHILEVE